AVRPAVVGQDDQSAAAGRGGFRVATSAWPFFSRGTAHTRHWFGRHRAFWLLVAGDRSLARLPARHALRGEPGPVTGLGRHHAAGLLWPGRVYRGPAAHRAVARPGPGGAWPGRHRRARRAARPRLACPWRRPAYRSSRRIRP